jgi:flagellar biosynthesis/type III secretory pathway chaperone
MKVDRMNMEAIDKKQDLLNTLEDLLVREFRACQLLYQLSREERVAISNHEIPRMLSLVEDKEAVLDELGRLDDSRRMTCQELGSLLGLAIHAPTVADLLPGLSPENACRMGRLREGILTVMDKVRDLNRGNHALASSELDRAGSVQSFLLSLIQPPATYGPLGMKSTNGLQNTSHSAPALEIDHKV